MAKLKEGSTVGGGLIWHSGNSGTPQSDWTVKDLKLTSTIGFFNEGDYEGIYASMSSNGNQLVWENEHGSFRLGPANSSWCHLDTNRPGIYFHKKLTINGTLDIEKRVKAKEGIEVTGNVHASETFKFNQADCDGELGATTSALWLRQLRSGGNRAIGVERETGNPLYYDGGVKRIFCETHHPKADTWTTGRKLTLTGDITGNATLKGDKDESLATTVAKLNGVAANTHIRGLNSRGTVNIGYNDHKRSVFIDVSDGDNSPTGNRSMGIHVEGDGNRALQLASPTTEGTLWFRNMNYDNGDWRGWFRVYHSGDKPSPGDFNAVSKTGDTMTGNLKLANSDLELHDTEKGVRFQFDSDTNSLDFVFM